MSLINKLKSRVVVDRDVTTDQMTVTVTLTPGRDAEGALVRVASWSEAELLEHAAALLNEKAEEVV